MVRDDRDAGDSVRCGGLLRNLLLTPMMTAGMTEFMIVELVGGASDGVKFITPPDMLRWYVPLSSGGSPFGTLPESPPFEPFEPMDIYDRGDEHIVHSALERQLAEEGSLDLLRLGAHGATRFYLQRASHE